MMGNKRSDWKLQVAFLPQEKIASSTMVRHGLESLCTRDGVSAQGLPLLDVAGMCSCAYLGLTGAREGFLKYS